MSDFQFINVYSGRSPQDKDKTSSEPALWNVYLNEKENVYLIQKIDENNNPTFEKYKISPTFFGVNFRQVSNVSLNKAAKKTMLSLKSESNKNLPSSDSKLVASAAKGSQDTAKKTGEYFIQLNANKPDPIQKKSENAPKATLSTKKATNEFNFNLNPNAPQKTSVDDFGLNSLRGDAKKAEQKKNTNSQFQISTENLNKPQTEKGIIETPEPKQPVQKTSKTIQLTQTVQINQTSQAQEPAKNLSSQQKTDNAAKADIIKENAASALTTEKKAEPASAQTLNRKTDQPQLSDKPEKTEISKQANAANASKEASPQKQTEKAAETPAAEPTQPDSKTAQNSAPEIEIPPLSIPVEENEAKAKEPGEIDKITQTSEALLAPKDSEENYTLSQKALKLNMAIRAEFQVSLTHWNSGKKNLAKRHFMDLINKQAKYEPAHKHVFTDIAIKLRKINLPDLALQSSTKCTKLSPDDSHAFFNVARLYYELNRYDEANEFIDKALELEADLAPAKRLSYVIKECIRRKAHNR